MIDNMLLLRHLTQPWLVQRLLPYYLCGLQIRLLFNFVLRTTNKQISRQRRLTVYIFTTIHGNALQIKTFLLDRICQCTRLIGTPKMRVALKSTTSVCKSCLRINEKDAGKSKLMSCLKKLFISDEMCTYKCCHEYV